MLLRLRQEALRAVQQAAGAERVHFGNVAVGRWLTGFAMSWLHAWSNSERYVDVREQALQDAEAACGIQHRHREVRRRYMLLGAGVKHNPLVGKRASRGESRLQRASRRESRCN